MTGPGGRVLPLDEVTLPGDHNTSNVLAAVAVGLLFGIAPDAIRRAVAGFHRRRASTRAGGDDRRRALRQRLAGHAARRGHRRAAQLRAADRADLRRTHQGRAICVRWPTRSPLRAAAVVLIGETADEHGARLRRRRGRGRSSRADDMARRRPLRRRDRSRSLDGSRTATVLLSPAATSFDMFVDYAARGDAFKEAVRDWPRRDQRGAGADRLIGRDSRPHAATTARRRPSAAAAAPILRGPQRERHEPDYLLLFSIVALAALGMLMVYSSSGVNSLLQSAIRSARSARRRSGACSASIAMLVVMRIDYRYLRLISVAGVHRRRGPARPGAPAADRSDQAPGDQRLGALAEDRPAAAHASGRVRQAGARRLPRSLARPSAARRCARSPTGCCRSCSSSARSLALVMLEPDLGTTGVLALTALTMFFVAGGSLLPARRYSRRSGSPPWRSWSTSSRTRCRASKTFLDPWADAARHRLPDRPGPAGDGHAAACSASAWARAASPARSHLPQAQNDFVFALVGAGAGLPRRHRGDLPLPAVRLPRHPRRARRARHVRRPARGRDHRLADPPGVHQHRRGRRAGADHRHHAAVRLGRRLVAPGELRRGRYPAFDLARDASPRNLERCGS